MYVAKNRDILSQQRRICQLTYFGVAISQQQHKELKVASRSPKWLFRKPKIPKSCKDELLNLCQPDSSEVKDEQPLLSPDQAEMVEAFL